MELTLIIIFFGIMTVKSILVSGNLTLKHKPKNLDKVLNIIQINIFFKDNTAMEKEMDKVLSKYTLNKIQLFILDSLLIINVKEEEK